MFIDDLTPLVKLIEADINNFLDRFAKEQDDGKPMFETFKTIWLDMNLRLIYSGREICELLIFQDLLLDTIKKRLFDPFPLLWNVGAVYLLRALIEHAPYKHSLGHIKLRLTLDDLRNLKLLITKFRLNTYSEPTLILLQIITNAQFVVHPHSDMRIAFVKSQTTYKGDSKYNQVPEGTSTLVTSSNSFENFVSKQFNGLNCFERLKSNCLKYHEVKQKVNNESRSRISNMFGPDIVQNLSSNSSIMVSNPHTIGDARKDIKMKSFKQDRSKRRSKKKMDFKEAGPSHSKSVDVLTRVNVSKRGKKFPTITKEDYVEAVQSRLDRKNNARKNKTHFCRLESIAEKIKRSEFGEDLTSDDEDDDKGFKFNEPV